MTLTPSNPHLLPAEPVNEKEQRDAARVANELIALAKTYAMGGFERKYGRQPQPYTADAEVYNRMLTDLASEAQRLWNESAEHATTPRARLNWTVTTFVATVKVA